MQSSLQCKLDCGSMILVWDANQTALQTRLHCKLNLAVGADPTFFVVDSRRHSLQPRRGCGAGKGNCAGDCRRRAAGVIGGAQPEGCASRIFAQLRGGALRKVTYAGNSSVKQA